MSRLIDCLADNGEHEEFEEIARDANVKIRELEPVKKAKKDIDTQMSSIAGGELAQKTELIFSDPTFHRIIAGLQPEIEGLPFALNGLGYNNLVFTSATLGTLRRSEQFSFRSIIIEEPEAHLHPQLQVLLLRHLTKVAAKEGGNEVQVIVSSHSPILASQAPINSIISVHEVQGKVTSVSMCSIDMESKLKKKLQRYLDATRGEIFFARRVIMVEGISEALIVPVLARIAGGCLKDSAVTVLNADGINFNAFIPLLGEGQLDLPVAILTDGDDAKKEGAPSATASGLKAKEAEIPNLRVEFGQITFEHELARSAQILPLMLDAYEGLHPRNGKELKQQINAMGEAEEKADAFLAEFLRNGTSKGCFAQELAALLDESEISADAVPQYIRNALAFVGVINQGEANDQDGAIEGADPIPEPD